jgi:hypothetical protein
VTAAFISLHGTEKKGVTGSDSDSHVYQLAHADTWQHNLKGVIVFEQRRLGLLA